jgi:hypothetical protein
VSSEDSRSPVAIRITRPYASEDEYIERELETLSRTGVVLLHAQPRPEGVILRFEVVLASGQPVLRGEGRVVGYKSNALEGAPGLVLRFTRLDTRSKALVDRVAMLRGRPSGPVSQAYGPGVDVAVGPLSGAPVAAMSGEFAAVAMPTPAQQADADPTYVETAHSRGAFEGTSLGGGSRGADAQAASAREPVSLPPANDPELPVAAPTSARAPGSLRPGYAPSRPPPAPAAPAAVAPAPVAPAPANGVRSPSAASPTAGASIAEPTVPQVAIGEPSVPPPDAPPPDAPVARALGPAEREALLDKLRARARALGPERLQALVRS